MKSTDSTNTQSAGEKEQPSTLPDLDKGDSIKISVRANKIERTLKVDEVKDDYYILTGYGTKYKLSILENEREPDWVMIHWQSTPEGEIVTNIEEQDAE